MADFIKIWHLKVGTDESVEEVSFTPAPSSIDEGTRQLPGGGYTTFRTFNRFQVLRIADHFRRLEETALLAGKPVRLDREQISRSLHHAVADYPSDEMRLRVILDLEQEVGDIYILVEPLHTPGEMQYRDGVRVITRKMHRENPKAKLTGFLGTASVVRHDLPGNINEVVMVGEDGRLLEGLSSNFFGVQGGTIYTADEGVLSGITRQLVLEEIRQRGLPICYDGLPVDQISSLDEAFITSASRAVLPVVEIDGQPVGCGNPGPVSKTLRDGYLARVEKELDTL